jgi:hypothetical protein
MYIGRRKNEIETLQILVSQRPSRDTATGAGKQNERNLLIPVANETAWLVAVVSNALLDGLNGGK